jgi:hypothetical protein
LITYLFSSVIMCPIHKCNMWMQNVRRSLKTQCGSRELIFNYDSKNSSDLAPFDFEVFPYFKSQLPGHRFENFNEHHQKTLWELSTLKQDYFENVYNELVGRHRKCIEKHRAYFKKTLKNSYDVMTFMTACACYV